MQDYLNKVVIMEHPLSHDNHVLAKVVKQTKATVVIQYWNPRQNQWSDNEITRRLITSSTITRIVGDDPLPVDKLALLQERLTSAKNEMDRRQRAAKDAYYKLVKVLECQ